MSNNPENPKTNQPLRRIMAKKCRASDWATMQKTCSESFKTRLPDHISGGEQGYMFSYNLGKPDEVWNWLPEKEFKRSVNPEYKGCKNNG